MSKLTLIFIFTSTFALGQDTVGKGLIIGGFDTKCEDISESTQKSIKIEVNDIVHEFKNSNTTKDKNSFNITQIIPRDNLATIMDKSMIEKTLDSLKIKEADYVMLGFMTCRGDKGKLKFSITATLHSLYPTISDMNSKTIVLTKKQLDSSNKRNDRLRALIGILLNPNRQNRTTKIIGKDTAPLPIKKKFFNATNSAIMGGSMALALASGYSALKRQEDWNGSYDQYNGLDVERKYSKENSKFKFWQGGVIAGVLGIVTPRAIYLLKDKKSTSKKESLSLGVNGSLNSVGLNIKF